MLRSESDFHTFSRKATTSILQELTEHHIVRNRLILRCQLHIDRLKAFSVEWRREMREGSFRGGARTGPDEKEIAPPRPAPARDGRAKKPVPLLTVNAACVARSTRLFACVRRAAESSGTAICDG